MASNRNSSLKAHLPAIIEKAAINMFGVASELSSGDAGRESSNICKYCLYLRI